MIIKRNGDMVLVKCNGTGCTNSHDAPSAEYYSGHVNIALRNVGWKIFEDRHWCPRCGPNAQPPRTIPRMR